ncbi:RloB family protein [Oceanobacillus locisalsi]|uniref:RloB family protein n=1 Tax=Oceanobacillus locisalsi TaxID=546107 RepID=A0ABW3NE93_9BACI
MRKTTPIIHMYIEAKQNKTNTEKEYFGILNRNFENIRIEFLPSYPELQKKVREANKKKNRTLFKNDEFVAILDGDIDYNNKEISMEDRIRKIEQLAKLDKVKIYLSNRCFENWIVLHYERFSKFTDHRTSFPIPDYTKTRSWYRGQRDFLLSNQETAIKNSISIRKEIYRNNQISRYAVDELPFLQSKEQIKEILELNPITYLDLLVEMLNEKNRQ